MPTGERFQIEPLERRRLLAGAIEGVVFNDLNGNATRDATEGVWPGITVWLDTNRNRVQDTSEPSAVTDATGAYRFEGLAAGEYSVRMVEPAWSRQTSPATGRASISRAGGSTARIAFTANEEVWQTTFTESAPRMRASIEGSFADILASARSPDQLFVFARNSVNTLYAIDPIRGSLLASYALPWNAGNTLDIAWMNGKVYLQSSFGTFDTFDPATGVYASAASLFGAHAAGLAADSRANELVVLRQGGRGVTFFDPVSYRERHLAFATSVPTLAARGLAFANGMIIGFAAQGQTSFTPVVHIDATTGQLVRQSSTSIASVLGLAGDGWTDHWVAASESGVARADFGLASYSRFTKTFVVNGVNAQNPVSEPMRLRTTEIVPGSTLKVFTYDAARRRTERLRFVDVDGTELNFTLPAELGRPSVIEIDQSTPTRVETTSVLYVGDWNTLGVSLPGGASTRGLTPRVTGTLGVYESLLLDGRVIYSNETLDTINFDITLAALPGEGTYRLSKAQIYPEMFVENSVSQYASALFLVVDQTAPRLLSAAFPRDSRAPILELTTDEVTFAGPGGSTAVLTHVASGRIIPTNFNTWQARLQVTPSVIAQSRYGEGRYRLVVTNRVDAAGNSGDFMYEFVDWAGDANDDAVVNFDDLLILAANYNQSPRVFSQGDFDRNGTVNFDDLLILASRYNTSITAMVGAPPPPSAMASGDDDEENPNNVLV